MFLQYFGYVSRSLGEIEGLLPEIARHLQEWAEGSYREGEEIRVRLGTDAENRLMAKTVSMTVGRPLRDDGIIRIPISWVASGTPGLFPTMKADLVLGRLADDLVQVKFEGSYQPPLGEMGRLIDKAVMHRVAEASVKNFVDRVIEGLGETPDHMVG